MLQSFFALNKRLSLFMERLLGPAPDKGGVYKQRLRQHVSDGMVVADVGGGKKPFLPREKRGDIKYVGIDIDQTELDQAPAGAYDRTYAFNIESPPLENEFDVILCKYTLEHVQNSEKAIEGLLKMTKPGGRVYAVLPCSHALFAKLNLWLPQRMKRVILFSIFPNKKTDGFPAYYDRATPAQYRNMIEAHGGTVVALKRYYWSSYFSFFVPCYLAWRAFTGLQYLVLRDEYCERFEIEFLKGTAVPEAAESDEDSAKVSVAATEATPRHAET